MQDNISCALITAFERQYDTSWDDPKLRNERLAMRYGWTAAMEAKQCLHQIQEPAAAEQAAWHAVLDEGRAQAAPAAVAVPDEAQIKALMRKHRIWIEHSTLFENDEPPRELRAIQAEQHQFEAFVQDLIALAATPAALEVPAEGDPASLLQLADLLESGRHLIHVERKEVANALRTLAATPAAAAPVVLPAGWLSGAEMIEALEWRRQAELEAISASPAASAASAAAAPVVLPEPTVIATSKRESPEKGSVEFTWGVDALKEEGEHKLFTEQQLRALLATATRLPAQTVANDNFKREIYAALGCGSEAAELAAITGIQNLIRREACLSAVERQFFMIELPPDELEGDTEPGEECFLKWGQEPEQYAEKFGAVLRLIAHQALADARDAERTSSLRPEMLDDLIETFRTASASGANLMRVELPTYQWAQLADQLSRINQ